MVCFRPWQAEKAITKGIEVLFCPREHAKCPPSQPFRSGATQGVWGERPPVIGNREHAKAPRRNAEALACSLRGSNPRHPD